MRINLTHIPTDTIIQLYQFILLPLSYSERCYMFD